MNTRRSLSLLAIVAALALFVGACGSSDDSATAKKDKTEAATKDATSKDDPKDDGSAEDVDAKDPSTKPISDDDFADELGQINDKIKAAGTDACAIALAQNTEPPEPTNPTQVAQVVGTYSLLLRSMAGALPDTSSANAKALTDAAEAIDKAAKNADYSADFFNSDDLMNVMTDPGVNAGITDFTAATDNCPGLKDLGETTPEG